MNISKKRAENIIFRMINEDFERGLSEDNFIISGVSLDETESFWVVGSNSEAFLKDGVFEKCYVGLQAHLVDTDCGEVHTVGSGQNLDAVISDLLDLKEAKGAYWILRPVDRSDRLRQIIALRKLTPIPMNKARQLVFRDAWFHGKKRNLDDAQALLGKFELESEVVLVDTIEQLVVLEDVDSLYTEDYLRDLMQQI